MKYAQYLDANATQEWKRAYIDYRALKKLIKRIKVRQDALLSGAPGDDALAVTSGDSDPGKVEYNDDSDSSDKEDHGPHAVPIPRQAKVKEGKRRGMSFWSRSVGGQVDSPRLLGEPSRAAGVVGSYEDEEEGGLTPRAGPRREVDPGRVEQGYGSTGRTPPASRASSQRRVPPLDLPDSQLSPELEGESRIQLPQENTVISPGTSWEDDNPLSSRGQASGGSDSDPVAPPTAHLMGRGDSPKFTIQQSPRFAVPAAGGESPPTPGGRGKRSRSLRSGVGKSPRLRAAVERLRDGTGVGVDPPVSRSGTGMGSLSRASTGNSSTTGMRFPKNLGSLYSLLLPDETKFFNLLDSELDKVSNFYDQHMEAALKRGKELEIQLQELAEHRRVFHQAEADGLIHHHGWEGGVEVVKRAGEMGSAFGGQVQKRIPFLRTSSEGGEHTGHFTPTRAAGGSGPGSGKEEEKGSGSGSGGRRSMEGLRRKRTSSSPGARLAHVNVGEGSDTANGGGGVERHARFERQEHFDPEKYQKYKKNLKIALVEYYKELEILKNYRILNLTGFKKALKKFGKTAQIRCVDLYMDDKVGKRGFAEAKTIDQLLKRMEDDYTESFEKGNHKRAVGKLRGQMSSRSHHWSTFLSGTYIGLGTPAFILGLVKSFQSDTQIALPQYEGLLVVYGTLYLPVLFAMLFELDLCAFVSARINYTFIMEIDVRTALDYRVFLEIPALLYFVLCWCFYFSFERVGSPHISPFAWPIVWIVFLVVFFLNPIPIYYQHARYWFVSVLGRVFTPGYSRVEFIAFFVADLINSLVYSFANLWFVGCMYNRGWPSNQSPFEVCPTGGNWFYGALSLVPALLRFIQCLKRYKDSRLNIHLINAGKYTASMLQYALFAVWRGNGSQYKHWSFAIWVVSALINSIYTSSWDLLVDWGLLRPDAGYLRESLGFPTLRPWYYLIMVVNVFIRFIWVWYIPSSGVRVRVRSFFFALCELLRRWIWAALRVETEQVGNTDQYRVSREVPLPYRLDQHDSDDELRRIPSRTPSKKLKDKITLNNAATRLGEIRERVLARMESLDEEEYVGARGPPGTMNAGPRGDYSHREYDRHIQPTKAVPKTPQEIERDIDED